MEHGFIILASMQEGVDVSQLLLYLKLKYK